MKLDRRDLLKGAAALGAASGLGGLNARMFLDPGLWGREIAQDRGGYGPISPVAAQGTGERMLSLPSGFQYVAIGRTGKMMSDGRPTPPLHDGMAAFEHNGMVRLIRNHEVRSAPGQWIADPGYDPKAGGGTTTLDVDPDTRQIVRDFVSISGTMVNCAGGPTPWNTWVTCEETVVGKDQGYDEHHGYCLEVPVEADGPVEAVPLREMGRFVHEAVAVDPATDIVYQTEDRTQSGFFRFIPNERKNLKAGGKLQMLAVKDRPRLDTRTGQTAMRDMECVWVDIDRPDPPNCGPSTLYEEGVSKGGATFARLEGCWWGNGHVYINATNGGDRRLGQVWSYRPTGDDTGVLRLIFESPSSEMLQAPDNICVSPQGNLVICEDGGGEQHLRGLTPEGTIFTFAKNILNGSEFAGATFSPDGRTLFVNIQSPGITLAIWGPWEKGIL